MWREVTLQDIPWSNAVVEENEEYVNGRDSDKAFVFLIGVLDLFVTSAEGIY